MAIGYHGVLLTGPSGCGKSDLALRLIDAGGRLVADDLVELTAEKDELTARPTGDEQYHGVMEVRGVGLLAVPFRPWATVSVFVIDTPTPERLPEAAFEVIDGIEIPILKLPFFDPTTPAKIRAAISYRRVA